MISQEQCGELAEKYYSELFRYFFARLGCDRYAAEDCNQELFVLLITKRKELEYTDNTRLWLYRAADNIIKAYFRKKNVPEVSIEEHPEVEDIASPAEIVEETESPLDILTDGEKKLLEMYYDSDYGDRVSAAKKLGISLSALYQKVHKLKQKLKKKE